MLFCETILQIMMDVEIYFHGAIYKRDAQPMLGNITHRCDQPTSVQDLINRYSLIPNVKVSINEELINDITKLVCEGDEIHFFRPVSGG